MAQFVEHPGVLQLGDAPGRQRQQDAAQLEDVGHAPGRQPRHERPVARANLHQRLLLDDAEGLAHRAAADAKAQRQFGFEQAFTRLERALDDAFDERVGDLLGQ